MAEVPIEIHEEKEWAVKWVGFGEELKKASRIAAPMVGVSVLQYLVQVSSLVIIGLLGEHALSSVVIATSLTNVTGFSLLSGLAGGLETLCGQAYGAEKYQKLGTYTYCAVISLVITCPPICLLWFFIYELLPKLGQDPSISHEAWKYSLWLIPALFGGAFLKPLTRFLQMQSLIFPMLVSAFFVLCFHVSVCWSLVYRLHLGVTGAALAYGFSTWLNVILLGCYVRFSPTCEKTRTPFSRDAIYGIGQFFRLGVASAIMVCLKWWTMEFLILFSGLLPHPKLEKSVLSICLTISSMNFTVAYGFGAAASTRVSNELGAGKPQSARMAVLVAMSLAGAQAAIVSLTLYFCRHVFGHAYSNNRQVVHYVAIMMPLICLSIITDSFQAVLSGVARGCGWQKTGAYVNLAAFYLAGLPVSAALGVATHLRGRGLWIGIVVGSVVQSVFLAIITGSTHWRKQVTKARKRVSG